jgi:hypothetical protein
MVVEVLAAVAGGEHPLAKHALDPMDELARLSRVRQAGCRPLEQSHLPPDLAQQRQAAVAADPATLEIRLDFASLAACEPG